MLKTMEYISGKLKTERGCKGQESNGSKKKGQNWEGSSGGDAG